MRKLLLLFLLALPAAAQVPVALSPVPHLQFLSNAGIPLAGGCIFTYQAGTTTPAVTYRDSFGITTNVNPIILNAGGFADIWLPNAAFKFTVKSAGGVNCASGGTLWTVDNISGVLGLLNLTNTWTGQNTFNQPIIINVNANQIQAGTAGNRTTLNFPAPAGNITLNMPSTADTMVGRATTDTLTNKSLTSPIINTVSVTGPPGTYALFTNEAVTGTSFGRLVKLTGAPSTAITLAAADTGGAIGICIINCSTTGISTLQLSGFVQCNFDATNIVSGDYVQISSTTAGDCHDAGANYPTVGQVIGRALITSAGPSLQPIILFGPEIKPASQVAMTTGAYSNATTVFTDVTNLSFSVAANTNYVVDCSIYFLSSATTAGPKFQFTGPAAPTAVNIGVDGPNSNAALGGYTAAFSSGVAIMGTVNASLLNFTAHVFMALQNGANVGTVQLQAAANGAGTLTVVRPSACTMRTQ